MMQEIITRKWAPVLIQTLRCLIQMADLGDLVLDNPWSSNGHIGGVGKLVLEKDDIDELVGEWECG